MKFVLQLVVWLQKQLMFKFAASKEQLIKEQQHNTRVRVKQTIIRKERYSLLNEKNAFYS